MIIDQTIIGETHSSFFALVLKRFKVLISFTEGFSLKIKEALLNRFKTPHADSRRSATVSIAGILFVFSILGCASVQQPMGGPRDVTPPKVLKMTPNNFQTNFKSDKIIIEFDEYFNIQNEFKEVSISPELEKPPLLSTKSKRLEIVFQDSLETNTTYTLNFGNAITDVNENNALKNFTYVFSTGPVLDSLSITGKVRSAFTALPVLDAMVFLLPASDTAFWKKKPSIYTRTDSSGTYSLKNLRKGAYRIYALKELNGDKLYQQGTEEIAFLKDKIELNGDTQKVDLQLFKELPFSLRVLDRKINPDGTVLLSFNRPLKDPGFNLLETGTSVAYSRFNRSSDSLMIWLSDYNFDSVKVAVSEKGNVVQTVNITRAKKDVYTRSMMPQDNLFSSIISPHDQLKLTFAQPVEGLDIKKISFFEDSIPRTNFQLIQDSTDKLSYIVKYAWKEKIKYEIRFADGAFTGPFNSKNKAFSKRFEAGALTDYANYEFNIKTPEKNKRYLFELINESKNLIRSVVVKSDTSIRFVNYRTGKYYVRIIYDANKNGVWDSGDLVNLMQPEKIWYDPRSFPFRTNWDVKQLLEIPLMP